MTKAQYLYGTAVDPSDWYGMPYEDVLNRKIVLANERIAVVNNQPMLERDSANITDCLRAIKFNEDLLKELTL